MRKCQNPNCANSFETTNDLKKFCCNKCRMEFHKIGIANFRNTSPNSKITTGQIGFISEMRVTVDLSMNGYEVFNALYNATCDIIAMKDEKLYRVEVKTGFFKSNKLRTGALKRTAFDILAIYDVANDKIIYNPPLP